MVSMTSVGLRPISSLNTATLLKPTGETKALPSVIAPTIQPTTGSGLAAIAELVAKLNDIKSGASGAFADIGSAPASGTLELKWSDYISVDGADIPAEDKAALKKMGADKVSMTSAQSLSDDEFQKVVLGWLNENYPDDENWKQAVRDGTVQIQRAADVPELAYRAFNYSMMSSSGEAFGSWSGGRANTEWYNAREAYSNRTCGSYYGQDYYATWPRTS